MDSEIPSPQALAEFDKLHPRILALVQERFGLELKTKTPKLDRRQRELVEDCAERLGNTLKAVFSFGLFGYMEAETDWLVSVLESRGLGRGWVESLLESWTIGIQGLVRPPLADELSRPLIRARSMVSRTSPEPPVQEKSPSEEVQKYLDLVLRGRRREAAEFVLVSLKAGAAPGKIAEALLLPALHHMGRLWEKNRIGAAEEHLATEITRYVIYRLFDGLPWEKPLPYCAFLACVPGDQHDIGIDLMANLLRSDGWSLVYIGRGAPHQDLLDSAVAARPDVAILSVSLISHLPAARALILGLRETLPGIPIILGGAAAAAARRNFEPLVFGITDSLEEGRLIARELAGRHA